MKKIYNHTFLLESAEGANVFLIGTPNEYMLIDSGIFMKTQALVNELNANQYKLSNLTNILLTHCHCDHIGGVRFLSRMCKAEVAAHKADIPYILQQAVIDGPYHNMMMEEQKVMKQLHCEVLKVDHAIGEGDIYCGLEVISVPGHTPGSIALYDREHKAMFFGDVIRHNDQRGLTIGIPEKFNCDTAQVHRDAEKLLSYDIEYALLSHGKPFIGKEEVDRLRSIEPQP